MQIGSANTGEKTRDWWPRAEWSDPAEERRLAAIAPLALLRSSLAATGAHGLFAATLALPFGIVACALEGVSADAWRVVACPVLILAIARRAGSQDGSRTSLSSLRLVALVGALELASGSAVLEWALPERAPPLVAWLLSAPIWIAELVLRLWLVVALRIVLREDRGIGAALRLVLTRTRGERARWITHAAFVHVALAAAIGTAVALLGLVDQRLAIVLAWVLAATFLAPIGLALHDCLVAHGRDRMQHDAELRDTGTVARGAQD